MSAVKPRRPMTVHKLRVRWRFTCYLCELRLGWHAPFTSEHPSQQAAIEAGQRHYSRYHERPVLVT